MDLKKKRNKKMLPVILLIFGIALLFSGYFLYQKSLANNQGEDYIEDDEDDLTEYLEVYKALNEDLCLKKGTDDCNTIAFTIKTKTLKTKILAFDEYYKFVLYSDNNKLKIYNKELEESQGILLDGNYSNYKIYPNENKDNIEIISFETTNGKTERFNVLTGKIIK